MADIPTIVISYDDLRHYESISQEDWTQNEIKIWDEYVYPLIKLSSSFGTIKGVNLCVINNLETTYKTHVVLYLLDELDIEYTTFI